MLSELPAPTRADDSPWVWGVDMSTKAVDVGALQPATGAFTYFTIHLHVGVNDGAQGLVRAGYAIDDWFGFRPTNDDPYMNPTLTVVESPFVRGGDQTLMMTLGVVLERLQRHVPCPLQLVPSSTWKLEGLGHGGLDKAGIMGHARALGYQGDRQDHADALGIAQCAAHRLRLARQHGDV